MSYRDKHPCVSCGAGYGNCVEGWRINRMCCTQCNHPSRWEPNPWTEEDRREFSYVVPHIHEEEK